MRSSLFLGKLADQQVKAVLAPKKCLGCKHVCAHVQLFTWVVGHLSSVLLVCTSAVTYRVILSSPAFSFILDFKACCAEVKLREVHFFRINRGGVCSPSHFPFSYSFLFLWPPQSKGCPSLLVSVAHLLGHCSALTANL